ncbi:hypothetical protein LSH36_366g01014 [Paralvinella palmiformis]|uniref:Uncharacterized protein n=1 Tax=Paralvinella palmiformis TaxID=53620 RepID=A0AAD9JEW8_9ANNE|nr:hypothetical protein LSH36_366g01014 [Paralvinella palmiformis]
MALLVSRLCLTQQLLCVLSGSMAYRANWRLYGGILEDDEQPADNDGGPLQIRHDHRLLLQRAIDRRWLPASPPATVSELPNNGWSARTYARPGRASTAPSAAGSRTFIRGQAHSKARLRRRETSGSAATAVGAVGTGPQDEPRRAVAVRPLLPVGGPINADEALAVMREIDDRPRVDECRVDGPVLSLAGRLPADWTAEFANYTSVAIGGANVLNNIFRTWDSRPTSLYNEAFYYSLAKSFLVDRRVVGGTIAFDRDQYLFYPSASSEQPTTGTFAPFVRANPDSPEMPRSLNLAELTKDKYTANGTRGYDWFWRQRKTFSDILWRQKDMCTEVDPRDVGASFDSVAAVTTTSMEGLWTDVYYDCERLADWVVTYSVPFFGCNNFSQLFFK